MPLLIVGTIDWLIVIIVCDIGRIESSDQNARVNNDEQDSFLGLLLYWIFVYECKHRCRLSLSSVTHEAAKEEKF